MTRRDFAVSGTSVSYGDYYTIAMERLARDKSRVSLLFYTFINSFFHVCLAYSARLPLASSAAVFRSLPDKAHRRFRRNLPGNRCVHRFAEHPPQGTSSCAHSGESEP